MSKVYDLVGQPSYGSKTNVSHYADQWESEVVFQIYRVYINFDWITLREAFYKMETNTSPGMTRIGSDWCPLDYILISDTSRLVVLGILQEYTP